MLKIKDVVNLLDNIERRFDRHSGIKGDPDNASLFILNGKSMCFDYKKVRLLTDSQRFGSDKDGEDSFGYHYSALHWLNNNDQFIHIKVHDIKIEESLAGGKAYV